MLGKPAARAAAAVVAVLVGSTLGPAPASGAEGSRIAFSYEHRRDHYDLFSIRADGTGLRRITHSGRAFDPSWSPRGDRIAFTRYDRDWEPHVWTVRPGGRGATRLRTGPASSDPDWSPDGERIVFVSDRTGHEQLYVHTLATGETVQLTAASRPRGPNAAEPAWSPDGRSIAYRGWLDLSEDDEVVLEPHGDLWTVAAAGGEPVRLTRTRVDERGPDWAPVRHRIVHTYGDPGDYRTPASYQGLAIRGARGDLLRRLPRTGEVQPAWSPDGRRIVAVRPSSSGWGEVRRPGLWVMGADGRHARRLLAAPWVSSPTWRP